MATDLRHIFAFTVYFFFLSPSDGDNVSVAIGRRKGRTDNHLSGSLDQTGGGGTIDACGTRPVFPGTTT
jgi:hypothetical protein